MIVLGFPLFAWLGMLTFVLILVQISLGIAMTKFHKKVMKFHKINGALILLLAITHMTLAFLFMLKGIMI